MVAGSANGNENSSSTGLHVGISGLGFRLGHSLLALLPDVQLAGMSCDCLLFWPVVLVRLVELCQSHAHANYIENHASLKMLQDVASKASGVQC